MFVLQIYMQILCENNIYIKLILFRNKYGLITLFHVIKSRTNKLLCHITTSVASGPELDSRPGQVFMNVT